MTIAFLDEQMTGRRQVRTHTAPFVAHRGSPARPRIVGVSTTAVVRPLRPATNTIAAVAPAAHHLPADHLSAHKLRLTRRGHIVFGGLLVIVALVVFSLGRFTAGADASAPPLHVTVSSGDTLWSIAEQAAPSADPRDVVDRIISANHLSTPSLVPGSVLLVPRG